ncbi:baseplate J/gp47 family protein [Xenorhabdus bovienii]|uniref:baseplate J/gp47 family protein n=1 Tax=Xenorhabdus bovienii TaxID=40576 RepID=UPI00237C6316|nr:baseplate J/gp47 family protein [Xenorhabdus bovienii]MDE1486062.1 baseplate J/gp47 family protein [Xenorhabdus bovienii]MDE9477568.1 baseplate J/gp47 family protein [Xenorhabdus bovienii]MDE9530445.1 baseplate J/gp47 family protein [Xenorhabdus bovienii]
MIPKLQITPDGILAPPTQEVIDGWWRVLKSCLGDNLNTDMNTPQGQLVTTLTAIITDERNFFVNLLNGFDPRYADGMMQDALAYIYFLQRKRATKSVAEITINGLANTVIPVGFQVSDDSGKIWNTQTEATIGDNGIATTNVYCDASGRVIASVGTINRVVKNINGVDSVINKTAAIVGRDEESRQEFELRRQESVAVNAKNTNAATYGAVSNINNVIDCYVIDNPSDETVQIGFTHYSLIRNSIAVSVVGGDDNEIAKQIFIKAGSGCSFVGNTSVKYQDMVNFPYLPPTYDIKFIRPTHVPIEFTVTFEDKLRLTHQDKEAIKKSILDEFGAGRGKGRIAKKLIVSDYICAVAQSTRERLIAIQIARKNGVVANYLDFGIDEFPTLSIDDIRIE